MNNGSAEKKKEGESEVKKEGRNKKIRGREYSYGKGDNAWCDGPGGGERGRREKLCEILAYGEGGEKRGDSESTDEEHRGY